MLRKLLRTPQKPLKTPLQGYNFDNSFVGCNLVRLRNRSLILLALSSGACAPVVDQGKALEAIEADVESCSHFLAEDPYDLERAIFIYREADKYCGNAKKGINELRGKLPGDSELDPKIKSLISKYLESDIEQTLREISSSRKFYEGEGGRNYFLEKEMKENDPFPYTAILTCSLSAFKYTGIPLLACMSNEFRKTTLRIRNGNELEVLKGWEIGNSESRALTDRGLEIPLARDSSVKIQNASDDFLLSMRVVDNDGNVIFSEAAEKYQTIEFNGNEN